MEEDDSLTSDLQTYKGGTPNPEVPGDRHTTLLLPDCSTGSA